MNDDQGDDGQRIERAEARLAIEATAKLREAGATGAGVKVEDLSRHGFRTEWPYLLKRGDRVWLTLPGIEPKIAEVRWVRGFQIGCKFAEAIHPAVFSHLVKRLRRK